jgi:hypothetical protein
MSLDGERRKSFFFSSVAYIMKIWSKKIAENNPY